MSDYEHPLSVTISMPCEEPRQEGIYSSAHPEAKMIYCRLNKFDYILIETISADLGIKPGTFLKQCAMKVAHELESKKNAYLESRKSR